jgi:hypothetical protein
MNNHSQDLFVAQLVGVVLERETTVANKLRSKQPRAHEAGGGKLRVNK